MYYLHKIPKFSLIEKISTHFIIKYPKILTAENSMKLNYHFICCYYFGTESLYSRGCNCWTAVIRGKVLIVGKREKDIQRYLEKHRTERKEKQTGHGQGYLQEKQESLWEPSKAGKLRW